MHHPSGFVREDRHPEGEDPPSVLLAADNATKGDHIINLPSTVRHHTQCNFIQYYLVLHILCSTG